MLSLVRPVAVLFALLTVLTGVAYPLAVTGVAKVAFADEAEGSLVRRHGRVVGSRLVGQAFVGPGYMWGRPSATSQPYDATASSGSNLAPTNPALVDAVRARRDALRAADPGDARPVPVDLVTASASGLDPDVSPASAEFQVARIARARGVSEESVRAVVRAHTTPRALGILGEPRVNVLAVNIALEDRLDDGK